MIKHLGEMYFFDKFLKNAPLHPSNKKNPLSQESPKRNSPHFQNEIQALNKCLKILIVEYHYKLF